MNDDTQTNLTEGRAGIDGGEAKSNTHQLKEGPRGIKAKAAGSEEAWKPVVGWPCYEISNAGHARRGGRMLRTFLNNHGYPCFNVSDGIRRKMLRVHREVAKCFVAPFTGQSVRHLDGNKLNSFATNIAWGTHAQNEADKRAHGRSMIGERHHRHKLSEAQVLTILASKSSGVFLASVFRVTPTTIAAIRKRKIWRHL